MAIGPMTVTTARESVVDFTKPFLSFSVKTGLGIDDWGIFDFLRPLSKEVWVRSFGIMIIIIIIIIYFFSTNKST